jgi:AcrR family transcriptional regulator
MATLEKQLTHEALVYSSDAEFLARVVPFLQEGISAGQPTMAVLMPKNFALVREALGHDAELVSFVDASTHYRRPSHALAEYRRQLDEELSRPGVELVRVVGELPFGPTKQEDEDWIRYEAVINEAWVDYPVWVICGYDTRALPEHLIADALHTHPFVSNGDEPTPTVGYMETDALVAPPLRLQTRRPAGGAPLARVTITREPELADLRRVIAGAARAGGLPALIVDDVTVGVGELARDGLRRGDGETSVRVVRDQAQWHCEVTGPASDQADDDLGLLIARLISERVEVDAGVGAQTVRITFSGAADARRRILDAASELFYQNGIRATGVNTIIAHSGVAKATFFRHFPAKEDLVFAWLRQPASRWFDRIRSELDARTEAPVSKLLVFFDLLGEWFGQDEFRGCAFQNAAAETPATEHPVRQATQDYALEIRHYLQRAADEAGLADPAEVAEQLHLLAQGAIATAVVTRSPRPARLARAAAERILA